MVQALATIVPLTNVENAQTSTITLHSVDGSPNITISMSLLVGDENSDRRVTAGAVFSGRDAREIPSATDRRPA